MPRSMVGRLAAVGTAMSALARPAHGDIVWIAIADATAATSLVVYDAAPFNKFSLYIYGVIVLSRLMLDALAPQMLDTPMACRRA